MLIYGYKGKKSLTSEDFWNNDATRIALFRYINLPNFGYLMMMAICGQDTFIELILHFVNSTVLL